MAKLVLSTNSLFCLPHTVLQTKEHRVLSLVTSQSNPHFNVDVLVDHSLVTSQSNPHFNVDVLVDHSLVTSKSNPHFNVDVLSYFRSSLNYLPCPGKYSLLRGVHVYCLRRVTDPLGYLDFFGGSSVLQTEQKQMLLSQMPKPDISYNGKYKKSHFVEQKGLISLGTYRWTSNGSPRHRTTEKLNFIINFCAGPSDHRVLADNQIPVCISENIEMGIILLSVTCHLGSVTCYFGCITHHLGSVTCHLDCVTCHLGSVTCYLGCITRHLGSVTCYLGCITRHLGSVTCDLGCGSSTWSSGQQSQSHQFGPHRIARKMSSKGNFSSPKPLKDLPLTPKGFP
ncbi:hypothetical protein E5288_WYG020497 [Bos mutus]|uniref:Uncharacterized protein n=1 Tax=Bos mutus TaxID=72004 RepID=A0A6B0SCF8_9CETA|nr:hypothetical protein [Bos mutus]